MAYKTMTNEEILMSIHELIDDWRKQFDNPPETSPVTFTVTNSGLLCANGVVLFPAEELDLSSLEFEVESVYLSSCDGTEYEIGFNWPVAGEPYLSFVKKTAVLYAAP